MTWILELADKDTETGKKASELEDIVIQTIQNETL